MATTAERLNAAVYKYHIIWTDLSARVVQNEGIPKQEADAQVAALIEKRAAPLAVAVALIDMIVEQKADDRDTIGEDGDQSGTHAGSRHKDNRREACFKTLPSCLTGRARAISRT